MKAFCKGFQLKNNGNNIALNCVGYEVLPNGLTHFYFHSNNLPALTFMEVRFDLLMDTFPEQQNKLTYLLKEKSTSTVFTAQNKSTKLELK